MAAGTQTALDWTAGIREAEEQRENEMIFGLWLRCHTQEEIAEATGVPQRTVADRIAVLAEKFPGTKSLKLSEYVLPTGAGVGGTQQVVKSCHHLPRPWPSSWSLARAGGW